jgi:DNA-binding beta-propeller fold protein YncE
MRVNHFDGEGRLALQWGTRGTNAGAFILPRSIAVNRRGEYFLSEYTVVDRVQRFDPAPGGGAPVFGRAWGEPGDKPGQFNRAEGLAVGPDDAVYVADSCNHRIQVFDREGKFLREHGRPGSNPGEYSYPYDVCVDAGGLQFVCEFGNSRVSVLDASDRLVEVVGGPGAGAGQFANPWSVALDSRGNLYVADSQNHRVQKLVRRAGGGR